MGPLSPRGPLAAGARPISWPGYEVSSNLWCDDDDEEDEEEDDDDYDDIVAKDV